MVVVVHTTTWAPATASRTSVVLVAPTASARRAARSGTRSWSTNPASGHSAVSISTWVRASAPHPSTAIRRTSGTASRRTDRAVYAAVRVAEMSAAGIIAIGRAEASSNSTVRPCARGSPRSGFSRLELMTLRPIAGRSPQTAPGSARLRAKAPDRVCHGR